MSSDKPITKKSLQDWADDLALELETMLTIALMGRVPSSAVIMGMRKTLRDWEKWKS